MCPGKKRSSLILGIPFRDLGAARLVQGWKALDAECARQRRLVEVKLLRRGLGKPYGSGPLAWTRFSDGRFGWCGNNLGIPGGLWPEAEDYEHAWEAGQTEQLRERGIFW